MICPKCGTDNIDGFTFCRKCGEVLKGQPPVEPAAPAFEPVVTPVAPAPMSAPVVPEPQPAIMEPAAPIVEPAKPRKPILLIALIITLIAIVGVVIVMLVYKPAPAPAPAPTPEAQDLAAEDFTLNFLKLEAKDNENLIYSPLSILYALNMLNEGANGETKTQIESILPEGHDLKAYKNINKNLSLANSIWIQENFKNDVREEFSKTLVEKYQAEVLYDPFVDPTNINQWLSDKTLGLIKNAISNLNPETRVVLANALAIDMAWRYQFRADATSGRDFTNAAETYAATTMSKTFDADNEKVAYRVGEDANVVSLPLRTYDATSLEFLAILPSEGQNFTEWAKNLTSSDLAAYTSNLTDISEQPNGKKVELTTFIPKFKFDSELKFKNDLISLGMTEAFDKDNADFSNISETPLFVSDAIHKATVDFSEDGIKAAAITVFTMDVNAMAPDQQEPERITIDFNRPFLFIIRDADDPTQIWFLGTVSQPNKWADDQAQYQR